MSIVLVYLGSRLPLYAALNLRHLRRTFPEQRVWLVTDNRLSRLMARCLRVDVFTATDPVMAWSRIRERMPYRSDFRKGFWFYTFARFFALAEFMESVASEPVLHLEADVWLASDFPFDRLASLDADIAFPMVSAAGGVASTLFLRSRESAFEFISCAAAWSEEGENVNDMGFLATLRGSNQLHVEILPSALASSDFVEGTDAQLIEDMTALRSRLGGIFDGASWGVDLLGAEPRNHWGWLRLFDHHGPSVVDTRRRRLCLGQEHGTLRVESEHNPVPLFSLHVHSKDLLMFLFPQWRLRQRLRQRRGGSHRVFLPHVLVRVVWSLGVPWLRRRLRKLAAHH